MWKLKLKEWGYKKNISTRVMSWIAAKGEARKLEGKDTNFFSNGTEVKKERIENFKRRRVGEDPVDFGKKSCTSNIFFYILTR